MVAYWPIVLFIFSTGLWHPIDLTIRRDLKEEEEKTFNIEFGKSFIWAWLGTGLGADPNFYLVFVWQPSGLRGLGRAVGLLSQY